MTTTKKKSVSRAEAIATLQSDPKFAEKSFDERQKVLNSLSNKEVTVQNGAVIAKSKRGGSSSFEQIGLDVVERERRERIKTEQAKAADIIPTGQATTQAEQAARGLTILSRLQQQQAAERQREELRAKAYNAAVQANQTGAALSTPVRQEQPQQQPSQSSAMQDNYVSRRALGLQTQEARVRNLFEKSKESFYETADKYQQKTFKRSLAEAFIPPWLRAKDTEPFVRFAEAGAEGILLAGGKAAFATEASLLGTAEQKAEGRKAFNLRNINPFGKRNEYGDAFYSSISPIKTNAKDRVVFNPEGAFNIAFAGVGALGVAGGVVRTATPKPARLPEFIELRGSEVVRGQTSNPALTEMPPFPTRKITIAYEQQRAGILNRLLGKKLKTEAVSDTLGNIRITQVEDTIGKPTTYETFITAGEKQGKRISFREGSKPKEMVFDVEPKGKSPVSIAEEIIFTNKKQAVSDDGTAFQSKQAAATTQLQGEIFQGIATIKGDVFLSRSVKTETVAGDWTRLSQNYLEKQGQVTPISEVGFDIVPAQLAISKGQQLPRIDFLSHNLDLSGQGLSFPNVNFKGFEIIKMPKTQTAFEFMTEFSGRLVVTRKVPDAFFGEFSQLPTLNRRGSFAFNRRPFTTTQETTRAFEIPEVALGKSNIKLDAFSYDLNFGESPRVGFVFPLRSESQAQSFFSDTAQPLALNQDAFFALKDAADTKQFIRSIQNQDTFIAEDIAPQQKQRQSSRQDVAEAFVPSAIVAEDFYTPPEDEPFNWQPKPLTFPRVQFPRFEFPKMPRIDRIRFDNEPKLDVLGFDVFVRRKGRFERSNLRALSQSDAFNLGAVTVENTAAASFMVLPSKDFAEDTFDLKSELPNAFMLKSGVYIEPRERRIKSRGELEEITFKGLKKLRL